MLRKLAIAAAVGVLASAVLAVDSASAQVVRPHGVGGGGGGAPHFAPRGFGGGGGAMHFAPHGFGGSGFAGTRLFHPGGFAGHFGAGFADFGHDGIFNSQEGR